MEQATVSLRVWGDYACFSRPEFKVERVSYPIITPSAARGVVEAIFWRPEIRYEIRRIGVLQQGGQTVILRNELEDRQGRSPILVEEKRQQRSSLILKDVAYLIEVAVLLRPHTTDPLSKYLDQLRRRIARGQYHHAPCLGMREFAADFAPADGEKPPPARIEIGTMLFDLAFIESSARREMTFKRPGRAAPVSGYAQALYFDATVENGWLTVSRERYATLYDLELGRV